MAYSQETENKYEQPLILAIVHRLLIPGLFLIFGVMYFFNTWGRFSLRNLRYPYFVLFILLLMLIWIMLAEIRELYNERDKYGQGVLPSLKATWSRWQKPIKVIALTFVYLLLVPPLGLITATFLFLVGAMRIAGVQEWKNSITISFVMTIVIYLAFVLLLNVFVPRGPLGF